MQSDRLDGVSATCSRGSGEEILQKGENVLLVLGVRHPGDFLDLAVDFLQFLLGPLPAALVPHVLLLGLVPRVVLAVAALLALAVGGTLESVVVALAVLLEAVGLLAVAGALPFLEFHRRPVPVLVLVVVLAAHALAEFVALAS